MVRVTRSYIIGKCTSIVIEAATQFGSPLTMDAKASFYPGIIIMYPVGRCPISSTLLRQRASLSVPLSKSGANLTTQHALDVGCLIYNHQATWKLYEAGSEFFRIMEPLRGFIKRYGLHGVFG